MASPSELTRARVVDALRRNGAASRAELARVTGLSRTTIGSIVADLQADGLLREERPDDSAERTGRGRPGTLLRLNARAGVALGVDFGHRHLRVALADLTASVLAERCVRLDVDSAATTALQTAVDLADEVLAEAGVTRDRLIGAGMGLPGPIDRDTGAVGSSVILPDWAGRRASDELGGRLGIRVEVDNDANLGALAESTMGAACGLSHVVYLKVSSGLGAGIILDGRLQHGATGLAGEIGHVQIRDDGAVCRCGNRGCLETLAASGALLDALRPTHGDDLEVRDLLELAASGDPGVERVIGDAGTAIGRVVGGLCSVLNPEAIVVGGELSAAGAALLEPLAVSLRRYALPGAAREARVMAGVLGDRAGVLGALVLVISDTDRLQSAGLVALQGADSAGIASGGE